MIIREMFDKPIYRKINGVIKVGQKDEDSIYQELDEYVVTKQLLKHFREFFENYSSTIDNPSNDIGVWISGFFGSGKSHFLKILSYLLDSNMVVKGKKPIDFFKEGKINDSLIIANMEKSASVSTDVRLFNIDSKSDSHNDKDAIIKVFLKEFNSLRGYCDNDYFFIADLERKLDEQNKYEEFKEEFEKINGETWTDGRDDFYLVSDDIIEALVNIEFMTEESANNWLEKAEDNYSITIEKLSKEINEYCEQKGNNHHIIFLVDEVGQYIGDNTQLMLSLQTLVEDLGINCNGKVWVVVTSQQDIDAIVKGVKNQDFSKIQGRFKTRLNLRSSNVDEVIRRRLLEKTNTATASLKSYYTDIEYPLKNVITFDNNAELKKYKNNDDFAEVYPFIPYQFNLLQSALTSIRQHSSTGKHLAEGERSMLGLFQEAAKRYMEQEDNTLIPFYTFYESLEKWIDHDKSIVIDHASDNEELNEFDVKILKTLLLIKHVDEIETNITNITTLIIDDINVDRTLLVKEVEKSLDRLYNQTLIGKNGDKYTFLTNEEQEINRAIKHEMVDSSEIINDIYERIYDGIFDTKTYQYNKSHTFNFNKSVDNLTKGHKNNDMGLRIITPEYDFNTETQQEDDEVRHNTLRDLSAKEKEAILYFNNSNIIDDIRTNLQIRKFLNKNTELSAAIKEAKNAEYQEQKNRIDINLEEAIKTAAIYINGQPEKIEEKHSKERINEALTKLCNKLYDKLEYMDFKPEKSDIKKLLEQKTKDDKDHKYNLILNDVDDYLSMKKELHENITLKDLIQRYNKIPYGFNDLEIQWIIIKLYTQKRINITYGIENFNEFSNDKKITTITQSKNYEKIIIEKKKQITERIQNDLKLILSEITETSIANEEIPTKLQEELNKIYEKIKNIKNYYTEKSQYPDKELVSESYELFNKIHKIDNEEIFIDTILENSEDILDFYEDLDPLFKFFEGNQKDIFEEAIKITKLFDKNKFNINSTKLEEYNKQIEDIIHRTKPYPMIKELPQICENFNTEYNKIIKDKKQPVFELLEEYEKILLNLLKDEKSINKFENDIKKTFQELHIRLERSKNISEINGFSDTIINIYQKYNTQIEKYIEKINTTKKQEEESNNDKQEGKKESTPTEVIKPKVAKEVYLKELSLGELEIKNNIELENFVNKLRKELKKELEHNEKINIKL